MLQVMSRGKVLSHFHDDLGLVDAMDNKVAARHDCTAFDDFGHVCLRPSNTGGALAGGMSSGAPRSAVVRSQARERTPSAAQTVKRPTRRCGAGRAKIITPGPGCAAGAAEPISRVCFTAVCPPGPAFARLGLVE